MEWRYGNSDSWNDWVKSNRKTTVLPAPTSRNGPVSAGNSTDGSNSGESTTVTVTVTSTGTDSNESGSSSGGNYNPNVTVTITNDYLIIFGYIFHYPKPSI
ncbi:MAG: hypothetical protein GXY12_03425 [Clostridiaceae bacterium]|nr:hypothetical protein [Clostridiaceae bacterium]